MKNNCFNGLLLSQYIIATLQTNNLRHKLDAILQSIHFEIIALFDHHS